MEKGTDLKQQTKTWAFWLGLVGMALLQTNTIPQTIKILSGNCDVSNLSLQMFVQTEIGLALYLYNALKTKNLLYIISNTIGLVTVGSIILAILLAGGF